MRRSIRWWTNWQADKAGLRRHIDSLLAEQRKAREVGDVGAIEKHGVFTRRYAINPFNQEKLPIWVANYILMDYGTGAIMSVPAHDERDYEFAKKYDLAIRVVVLPRREGHTEEQQFNDATIPYSGTDSLLINSGEFSGLGCHEAMQKMAEYARQHGFGKPTVTYRLKDWGISRQRYWGTPIPMLYCEGCGIVPVPEKDLPVPLPENVEITLTGGSPLGRVPEWVNTTVSEVRRPGAPRNRHHGHLRRFILVLLSLYRRAQRPGPVRQPHRELLVPHRAVHRRRGARHPAPDLLALLDQVHARHGPGGEFASRCSACSPRAW